MPSNASRRRPSPQDTVSSELDALAVHMRDCRRGGLFKVHSALDRVHGIVQPRVVTTTALFCALALALVILA